METLIYYSRNAKNPPFEVTVQIDGNIAYINCNCELGLEKKICRHKINAIRADKSKSHTDTDDYTLEKLKKLFNINTTLRQHLEQNWEIVRTYEFQNPENKDEISRLRSLLGEAYANGFSNEINYNCNTGNVKCLITIA
ncbi:MAG: hypothetical protein M1579_01515 [Gammaproteobacteria bacterium]|nr:hypothetical protein [Gammaproteobacteria bacterium]